ncbi:MAG TPA: ABC transporter ATP-binding protein [Xanthomonadales bacterium]|nr:ABC transporter ATP-binding protein [Xanthomonadales bacterium]
MQVRGLSKSFGQVHAVSGVDLTVPRSIIYGFLGPNGSGKSTTIRMLCGLLLPTAGEIEVLGYSIPQQAEELRRKVGYMTQRFSLYEDLSAQQNLDFIAGIYNLSRQKRKQRQAEVTERYGLSRFLQQLAGSLSGGQKQRLALAAATLHEPELLFLDEPTSAVDPENRRAFWETLFDLCSEGTTILVSTHYMDEAERCHQLAILDQGVLVADGSPAQLSRDIAAQVLLVIAEQPRRVSKVLEAAEFVHSTAQIGNSLRVLVDQSMHEPEAEVQRLVAAAGLEPVKCSKTVASLEDVFVEATQRRKAGR